MNPVKSESNMSGVSASLNETHKHNPINIFHHAQALVKPELDDAENALRDLPDLQPASLREAIQLILNNGGKRIRPLVALLVAGMFDAAERQKRIDLAAAVEMLHTSTLVHDDLIDGSLMRRGTKTLNAVWTPAATVLTGDYLFAYAANLAARVNSVRVMSIFADTLSVIVGGELRQMFTDWALRTTRDDYFRRIYGKTASMFVLATSAAGVISNASESQITALLDYGRDFGIAFQIMDDVLDFTGDQASVGKPVGSDLRRGMITLPTICYIESNPNDSRFECALRGECDNKTYDQLIDIVRNSDAIERSIHEAKQIAENAKRSLDQLPANEYREVLRGLVDYSVGRSK
jgi:geranylgeranyl pyrophosphate synthase